MHYEGKCASPQGFVSTAEAGLSFLLLYLFIMLGRKWAVFSSLLTRYLQLVAYQTFTALLCNHQASHPRPRPCSAGGIRSPVSVSRVDLFSTKAWKAASIISLIFKRQLHYKPMSFLFSAFKSFHNPKLKAQHVGLDWGWNTLKAGYVQPQSPFQTSPWEAEKAPTPFNDFSSFQFQVKFSTRKELHWDLKIPL